MVKTSRLLFLTVAISFICMVLASCIGYRNDGKQVTFHEWNEASGHKVTVLDADPATFEDLGDGYGRDAKHAFLEGNIIKGADGNTFNYLGKNYAVDANRAFHFDSIIPDIDPKSFKVHSNWLTEDKNDFYWNGKAIHVADKKTFVVIGDDDDEETLWAKDKYNAYYMGYPPVPLADYESFHPINDHTPFISRAGDYAVDKYRVYYKDHIVEGADPESFKEVFISVGQDKYRVYYEWKATKIKNYEQLSIIGDFRTDGLYVYTDKLEVLEGADPHTFKQIEDSRYWYADKDHVWHFDKLVKEADVSSFQPVYLYEFYLGKIESRGTDFWYGKDKNHVFYEDSIISGADPSTFEKIGFEDCESWTVFDKNRIYEGKNSKALQKYLRDKYGRKQ